MEEKNTLEAMEEETIETYEFTDEDGVDRCFVVENRFKVGQDDYVALLEVDPAIFAGDAEEECECGCGHEHVHDHAEDGACDCGHEHAEEDEEEDGPNIILAKIAVDANGDVDIQVPSDEEFAQAKAVYEKLDA